MTNTIQFIGPIFLICTLFFNGCGPSGEGSKLKALQKVAKTPADLKKEALLRQIERKFENPGAHFELGRLYQADGLWAEAEHHYNVALSFNPANRHAQAGMVKVLTEGGDTAKAQLSADIYMNQVSSSASESLRLALAFQEQRLDEYALACYSQALRLAPNSPKINRQIGYYYLSRNNKAQARDYLTRSFQLDPKQPEVAGELGRLGVAVQIPRITESNVKKLDKIVEESDK